jgi:hypothetical protein
MGLDLRFFGTLCSCLVAIRLEGRKNRCPFSGRAIAPTLPFTVNLSREGSKKQNRSDLFNVGFVDYGNRPLICQGETGEERLS